MWGCKSENCFIVYYKGSLLYHLYILDVFSTASNTAPLDDLIDAKIIEMKRAKKKKNINFLD